MRVFCLPLLLAVAVPLAAIDRDVLREWTQLQESRPEPIASLGRIASASEPGIPLRLDGRVLTNGGRAAVRDAIVFAWQTDAAGLYDHAGAPPHSWRLHGWAKTDATGRFSFLTIRPVPYPSGREPAHVHFTVERGNGSRYMVDSLMFDDDPLLTPGIRAAEDAVIAHVRQSDEGQSVGFILNLEEAQRF